MANSSDVIAGTTATALQYNNLRKDVLDPSTGHTHSGTDSAGLAANCVSVNQIVDTTITDAKLNYTRWKVIYYSETATNYIWTIPTTGSKQFKIKFFGECRFLNSSDTNITQSYCTIYSNKSSVAALYGDKLYIGGSNELIEMSLSVNNLIGKYNEYSQSALSADYSIFKAYLPNFNATKLKFTGANLIIEELIEA